MKASVADGCTLRSFAVARNFPLRGTRVTLAKLTLLAFLLTSLAAAQHLAPKAPGPDTGKTATPTYTPGLDVTAMDNSVDPCVDFYAYACGGWQKMNPIPADQSSWSLTAKLQEQNRELLRSILENAAAPDPHRGPAQQKIGDFYASCMDEKAVNAAGAGALKPDLDRIAGLRSKAALADFLAHAHPEDIGIYFGRAALFGFGSTQDAKNSAEVIAEVDQGGLGLPDRDYYLKDDSKSQELRAKYLAHVQKMLELTGETTQVAAADAQSVMRIEIALAKGSMTRVQRRDPKATYHRMSRQQLQALSPAFPWDRYLGKYGLQDVPSLNVAAPDFVKAMDALIAGEAMPALQAYLRWHLVHAQARWLATPLVEEDFNFYGRTLTGARQLQARWKRCVTYTDRALGEALGQAYVEVAFSAEAKQRTVHMVEQIEQAMSRDIQQLDRMSEPTKQQALAKLRTVVNKIGYPDKWRDYAALKIGRGDALGNGERAYAFEFMRQLGKIGKPVDRTEWYITTPTVNAYYDAQNNSINFPAGILQPPLFDPKMDDAPNYGDTGGTIGHELTHGFDDQGRQFDAQGNLRDWWQPQDGKEFERRAQCIADQYAQYTIVDDVKINSKLTLGEDVADVGGLILAYMAWREQTRGRKLEPVEGLTPEQRFFIGYGQSWCSNQRPEAMRMRAMTDPHSPPKYRTNGVVRNMPEFQEAFHCKTGQPMAPKERCRVW
ncbi:MAG: M13 family metallopeptidase [Acidobacteriia bacterium]|nr:M13 family metallopeptidase [Terriglobia bacterium]